MFKELKWFFQRGKKGYSDRDLWSPCEYLCTLIPPMMRDLAKRSYGCPGNLWDAKAKNNECHRWEEVLEEIAQGFEAAKELDTGCMITKKTEDGYYRMEFDKEKAKQCTTKFERGMFLFQKYFFSLWD